jgi:hypothetical protein
LDDENIFVTHTHERSYFVLTILELPLFVRARRKAKMGADLLPKITIEARDEDRNFS